MGQKHKRFREFRTPFPLCDIRENPRSNVRACTEGDGAICSKNRKIVPYHGASPNTRNGARLRSPLLIMAPECYDDQKTFPFFSSDFESVFAYNLTGKILSLELYPKAVYFECKFWILRSAVTHGQKA